MRKTHTVLPRLLPVAALLSLSLGCTYVTQKAYDEHLEIIDEDHDDVPRNKDCDDRDSDRFPGNVEVPYDGVDNDCDGFDLVDVDGDQYPGIAQEDWVAAHDGVKWPASTKAGPVDCADDPDVIPEARTISPAVINDPPYDGLDSNCDGANDFDADGDGDMPDGMQADYAAYAAVWGVGFPESFTDCDDTDSNVYGGAPDAFYDGVDSDCAGNDDYDQDGDGSPLGDADDCDDADAAIFPGATDIAYDGIDSDCGCNDAWDNDYDADGDDWILDGDQAAQNTYAAIWCADQTPPVSGGEGDCNDNDASVNPGALEGLQDGADSDCDGNPNASPFADGGLAWTSPRPPALAGTNLHYVLVSAGDSFSDGTLSNEVGVALTFDVNAGPGDSYVDAPILWQGAAGAADPLGATIDAVANGDSWWAATAYTKASQTFLVAVRYEWNVFAQEYTRGPTDSSSRAPYDSLDVAVGLDSRDNPWAWSVGTDLVHVLHGDGTIGPDESSSTGLVSAQTVMIEESDSFTIGTATSCDDISCETWSFDGITLGADPSQPWALDNAAVANEYEGVKVLVDPTFGVTVDDGITSQEVLAGINVVYAEGAMAPNGIMYIASVIDTGYGRDVWLTFGDPNVGSFTDVWLPHDITYTPTGTGIHVDDTRIFIAISGEDGIGNDYVGWTWLQSL